MTKYIDMRATKKQIADSKNSEQYVHYSLYKTKIFTFWVAQESMYFPMEFYTRVVHILLSMWNVRIF